MVFQTLSPYEDEGVSVQQMQVSSGLRLATMKDRLKNHIRAKGLRNVDKTAQCWWDKVRYLRMGLMDTWEKLSI